MSDAGDQSPRRSRSRSRERRRSRSRDRRRSRSRDRGYSRRSPEYGRRSRSPDYSRRSRSPDYRPRSRSPPRRGSGGGGGGYDGGRQRSPPPRGSQLYVAGFLFRLSERDVADKFGRYGDVREVRIMKHIDTGVSRGFGFVIMSSEEEAERCVRHLDGRDWNGRRLQVEIARNAR